MSAHDLKAATAAFIQEIGRLIAADPHEHCTRDPLFLVQKRERLYGFDLDYSAGDDAVWISEDGEHEEADEEQIAKLDALTEDGKGTPGWVLTGFVERWEFVTACFTQAGAERYIAANKHRHSLGLRVYVDSLYRNDEMLAVRKHLMRESTAPADKTIEPAEVLT